MLKEIATGAERAFLSIPESFRDHATVRAAQLFLEFGPGHSVKTRKARRVGVNLMTSWYKGDPTPLSELAESLFEGFRFNYSGVEKLPNGSGEIFVVNQPNTGPLRGNWFKFLVNHAVAEARGRIGNYEARWVQKEISEKPIFQKTPIGIQKRRLSRMIHNSCGTILIDPAAGGRENLSAVLMMRRHLQNNGVLVVCPEGQDRGVLGRGKPDAGKLVGMLVGKRGVAVRPVGVWNSGNNLNVNFGDPMAESALKNSGQKIADSAMIAIAKLLPRDKRGVYSRVVTN